MKWCPYTEQRRRWPHDGRHILAQYDDDNIIVYQAYNPAIADWAVANQRFGGPWSFERMSWIKPNFLWMMYRCGWAAKKNQERVLAVTISREGFETILSRAVDSSYHADIHGPDRLAWRLAGKRAGARMQWDPDHTPHGTKEARRAIQLGLRGDTLRQYATEWLVKIDDITHSVQRQHELLRHQGTDEIRTPCERRYDVRDDAVRKRIRLSAPPRPRT